MSSDLRTFRKHTATLRFDPWSPKKAAPNQVLFQPGSDEKLIQDARAALRPAQMVENKICRMLRGAFVMVSQLRLIDMIRRGSGS
jgi:hypothetical protein